jgi:hypothetical protein
MVRYLPDISQPDIGQSDMHNKRLEAFRSNPGGDWVPADFEITASQCGQIPEGDGYPCRIHPSLGSQLRRNPHEKEGQSRSRESFYRFDRPHG